MIQFHERELAGIPCLEASARPDDPVLVVLHSFGVSKELVAYFGLMGAQRGFRVLLPEAPGHGNRAMDPALRPGRFWDILCDYVDDLTRLHQVLGGRITVAGTSMGAFAALAAGARHEFVPAVAAYMGTAFFRDAARTIWPPLGRWTPELAGQHDRALARLADYDPAARLPALACKPVWLWHGARDDVVPVADALRLAHELTALGARDLRLTIDPNGSHRVTDAAAREGLDFLAGARLLDL